ncbi:MAG: histidine triad nucleotide-binding protein [Rhizobacter sp.]|nr:histidine triad nucleotide-binding protein [Chlorobiales bacterium]
MTYSETCLFCKIAAGKIPSKEAYSDADVFAFHDIAPQAPVHLIIIPKTHIATLNDLTAENADLIGKLVLAAKGLAKSNGLAERGYRLNFNCNADAGQSVFHIHLHLLGGKAMGWPPFPKVPESLDPKA